jgi:anti-sigma factor ChrR (cupin superfamily)
MNGRTITNPINSKLKPFNKDGVAIPNMSWHEINFDQKKGFGTFILSMLPGTKSTTYERPGLEEIYMLEGELIDADGTVFKKGELITFEPGTTHSHHSVKGCMLLVFIRAAKNPL